MSEWSNIIWVDPLVLLALLATIAAAASKVWRGYKKQQDKFDLFLRDWHGESQRPGVPRVPGVMERLQDHDIKLSNVQDELNFNHGHSVKDVVNKIAKKVGVDDI